MVGNYWLVVGWCWDGFSIMAAALIRTPELARAGREETLISHISDIITISSCSNYISAYSLTYDFYLTYYNWLLQILDLTCWFHITLTMHIISHQYLISWKHQLVEIGLEYDFDLAYHQLQIFDCKTCWWFTNYCIGNNIGKNVFDFGFETFNFHAFSFQTFIFSNLVSNDYQG